jgi:hypothetical protein
MEQQFRRILGDPAIPARDRVRLSCALGALLSSLMTVSDLGDLSIETYGDLLREAITDLLEPRATLARPIAPTEDEARRCELGRGRNSFGAQITAGRGAGGQVSAEATLVPSFGRRVDHEP